MSEGNGPQSDKQGSKPPTGGNQRPPRGIMSWVLVAAMMMVLIALFQKNMQSTTSITLSAFAKHVANKNIKKLVISEDGVIEGELVHRDGMPPDASTQFKVIYPKQAIDDAFIQRMVKVLPDVDVKRQSEFWMVMLGLLPWLFMFAIIWFFLFRQMRGAGGAGGMLGNFGRSRHRVTAKEHTNVTFADVAGIEESKEEVEEIIQFLRAPKKFQRLGGRVPRGILLVGEPGCGKTLLAKAIAGEAEVPFLSISGSDFVEMFVGVGASRVRDLFKQAKESSPCIIFLDEIDAVGRKRGASFGGGGHDEREQTLNAILVEMDGFETNQQVIVIAATNRVDVLDPALIRPGRFDRQVYVSLPDLQGRYEILKVHAKRVKLGPTADLRRVARGTPMFSGAELAALVNEAAIIATLSGKDCVEQDDMEEARDKIKWGRAKKSRVIDETEQKVTAYHEAGHALVQALDEDADPVHKVTVIPRGPAGGATFSLPEKDRTLYTRKYLLATMRVLMAGRIAEEMIFNELSTGASQDIKQSTMMAEGMIREWGMGKEAGVVYYGDRSEGQTFFDSRGRDYSDKTAEMIDGEIKATLDKAYADAKKVLTDNRDKLDAVAEALLSYETITGEEVDALIRGESLERASVADLLDEVEDSDPDVGMARPIEADSEPRTDLDDGTLPAPG